MSLEGLTGHVPEQRHVILQELLVQIEWEYFAEILLGEIAQEVEGAVAGGLVALAIESQRDPRLAFHWVLKDFAIVVGEEDEDPSQFQRGQLSCPLIT